MSRQAGFSRAGRSGHQNAAAPVVAFTAEHGIQGGDTGGNPLIGGNMFQVRGSHWQHGDAVAIDQEGVVVRAVDGTAILHDAKAPRQYRFGHLVVQ